VLEKFRRICYCYNIRTVFKTKYTLGSYLRKTKPKLDLLQDPGAFIKFLVNVGDVILAKRVTVGC
jgi:hypothetical protein